MRGIRQAWGMGVQLAYLLVGLVLLCLLVAAVPQGAYAKSYRMPSVDIQAHVEADGSLHVVEQRSFDFDGSFSAVWWVFDKIGSSKRLVVENVQVSFGKHSEEMHAATEVPFETEWRTSGGPSGLAYSVDDYYDAVYVFFESADVQDGHMTVLLEYRIENAVAVHMDCAELYWQYLGADWGEDSRNVSCVLSLPAGGKTGMPGETVRAWGHGPLSGRIAFDETGTKLTYTTRRVKSGEFAEARVVFPRDWLKLPANYPVDESPAMMTIRIEEDRWARQANRGRLISLVFFGTLGLIALCAVGWSVVQFLRYGREYKPAFTDKYWRDVPNKDVHPTVIGRLMNWDSPSSGDAVTTILHLADQGVVSLGRGTRSVEGEAADAGKGTAEKAQDRVGEEALAGQQGQKRSQEAYCLTLREDAAEALEDPIDKGMIDLLFNQVAKGEHTLWLDDIKPWAEKHKSSFGKKMEKWQNTITKQTKATGYFEEKGEKTQENTWVASFALITVGFYGAELAGNFWPMIFFWPAAVLMIVLAFFMPRRTRKGAEDYARAKAFKRWLQDFTLLDERLPTDVKVWGRFMVYAQLFGVAEQVLRQLRDKVPGLLAEADAAADGGLSWSSWYVHEAANRSGTKSFMSDFERTWANTAALASVASGGSSGGFSSGGGFGGGFSGGGGGGFGGGGGGAR